MDTTWIVIGVVVVVGLWLMMTYNRLVSLRNQASNAWS
jgi:LemA protein